MPLRSLFGVKSFPFVRQLDAVDCGPTCLAMISRYYGRSLPLPYLRELCHITRQGVSLHGISYAAETLGLRTLAAKINLETLAGEAPLPAIVHWRRRHFAIVYKVTKKRVYNGRSRFWFNQLRL